ncbi:DNA-binding domain-containing protein [Cupriavidus sp. CV2]|uniref:HvfC/BufC N-terminal domain-containing protein n=1 Tax=Cupriavidus ulmosensis TaxID=3065913 RepID=UPI00296ADC8A|nr:DNA-binding domain-containing protein [Cupriavidus sp. CV2]MDW3687298.1 DNA-binding domain-containing protein [Cupriavidus sp. CV2]
MMQTSPTLLELQQAFAQNLLCGGGGLSAYVIPGGLEPEARLNIYRDTATSVFVTALKLSYPAVQALVGEEFFEGAARLFLESSPPRSAWLDAYGAAFPDFLAELPEAATLPYLPDTARLEWVVNTVLHAREANPLALASLARLTQAEMGCVCFEPHPAVRLLRASFPVDDIWHAVLAGDDGALGEMDPASGPVSLLLRRSESGVEVERLDACQWRFAAALFEGQPLHACLDAASPAAAPGLLARLLAAGCFAGIRLTGDSLTSKSDTLSLCL